MDFDGLRNIELVSRMFLERNICIFVVEEDGTDFLDSFQISD